MKKKNVSFVKNVEMSICAIWYSKKNLQSRIIVFISEKIKWSWLINDKYHELVVYFWLIRFFFQMKIVICLDVVRSDLSGYCLEFLPNIMLHNVIIFNEHK